MSDKPNFILVPDEEPESDPPPPEPGAGAAARQVPALRGLGAAVASAAARLPVLGGFLAPRQTDGAQEVDHAPSRPRLIFGVDATASREPAWATARQVTDALVRALPGELDVALAVHGGSRLHTFTEFTANPGHLRDRAAGVACISGHTRMLPILSRALAEKNVRVVVYIGDVFEESPSRGRRLADDMGKRGIRLIVLHDVADWTARRDAELFLDLARRTGGCVLPFDASAAARLRELLAAVAVYAVGGTALLREKEAALPGATLLLRHLDGRSGR
jgi:hypothetical protein